MCKEIKVSKPDKDVINGPIKEGKYEHTNCETIHSSFWNNDFCVRWWNTNNNHNTHDHIESFVMGLLTIISEP